MWWSKLAAVAANWHVLHYWVEAQSARWCVVASVRSGHAQQRTLLWLGHPPLGLDMVCPSRLDVACHVKVVVHVYLTKSKPLGWQEQVSTNSTLLGANPSVLLRVRLHPVYFGSLNTFLSGTQQLGCCWWWGSGSL